MTTNQVLILIIVWLFTLTAFANDQDTGISLRGQQFDRQFFAHGRPVNYLDVKISPGVPGTRELRTVLPGALYRGGGPGGTKPLPATALKALCEAGFSLAVYSYTENWTPVAPISCTNSTTGKPNKLEYISGGILDKTFKQNFLKRVREVIENPDRGPVFVHCWNGYHASGEMAAIALRQFCGWSGDNASAYWSRHANGAPMISRVRSFTPSDSLNVEPSVRDILCVQSR